MEDHAISELTEKMLMDQNIKFGYGKVDDNGKRFISFYFESQSHEWALMVNELEQAIKRGLKKISQSKELFQ